MCGFPGGSDGKESPCNVGDMGSIPGPGRSPGEGTGNPLQCSCLENPMDRGAWRTMGWQRVGHDWATTWWDGDVGWGREGKQTCTLLRPQGGDLGPSPSFLLLFTFGCAGSLLPPRAFSSCCEQGLLTGCSARASQPGGFSCCRAWALGPRTQSGLMSRISSVITGHAVEVSVCSRESVRHGERLRVTEPPCARWYCCCC